MHASVAVDEVAACLERLYVGVPGATLRREDRRKAEQVAALLLEIQRALSRTTRSRPVMLVDAAAGKAYVGLLAAQLLLKPAARAGRVVAIEREPERLDVARRLADAQGLGPDIGFDCRAGDVGDETLWPTTPDIVTALHACGPAADVIINRVVAARARHLLLVPCCTGAAVHAGPAALALGERLGVPRQAPVRRRFVQAIVDAERTLRLEAAGYETEVVELVPPSVTPHNLLFRSRLVGEPARMAQAQVQLRRLLGDGPDDLSCA